MRIAWVLGWAVPETWFAPLARAALPVAEHGFFAASPNWLAQVCASGPWEVIAGHSLGTLLLLQEAAAVSRLAPRVVLFAPVFGFPREAELGGCVERTQVNYLMRWLRKDRCAALEDFYVRAGLAGCGAEMMTAPDGQLQWGLERLANDQATPVLPAGWRAYAGGRDALLDAGKLAGKVDGVMIVAEAAHHPDALLRAWTEAGL
jgi:hypothetical protein